MVKINKIYTKTGDGGQTHLVGGDLVAKDCLRIQTVGEIDELNAAIGVAAAAIEENTQRQLREILHALQQRLFDLGAEVATPADKAHECPVKILVKDVSALEKHIDELTASLPALESFVLPGGHPICAALHFARTVCRRAERSVVALSKQEELSEFVLQYVNRLSDYLFALSRHSAQVTNTAEVLWDSRRNKNS